MFQEFGFGFADGIAGLAIQPLEGAKKGGAAGAIKGIAKGISGLVLKPSAGKCFVSYIFVSKASKCILNTYL